jgi:hypothetical protein
LFLPQIRSLTIATLSTIVTRSDQADCIERVVELLSYPDDLVSCRHIIILLIPAEAAGDVQWFIDRYFAIYAYSICQRTFPPCLSITFEFRGHRPKGGDWEKAEILSQRPDTTTGYEAT